MTSSIVLCALLRTMCVQRGRMATKVTGHLKDPEPSGPGVHQMHNRKQLTDGVVVQQYVLVT